VLASNRAHADLLDREAFYRRGDPAELAAKLSAFAALTTSERDELGRRLRERVRRAHSVDLWADGLLRAALPL
jgi:hypothetical protein